MVGKTFDPTQHIEAVNSGQKSSKDLHKLAQEAIEWARDITREKGESSPESAAAWDTVEELLSTISHQKTPQEQSKTYLENYCEEYPESDQCRVYDV